MGNSFGCSASGERLVSAARDGDFQEAQALLACNPRLAKYSTFGVRNSPLHFSAMQGHNEVSSSMSLKHPFFPFFVFWKIKLLCCHSGGGFQELINTMENSFMFGAMME
jgi:hypothetical protein